MCIRDRMNGFQSQLAFVMPEQDLVIVRFGATNYTSSGSYALARSVAASLRDPNTLPQD